VAIVMVLGCGDNAHEPDYLGYAWDDRRVLCSTDIDNLDHIVDPEFYRSQIEAAATGRWAAIMHTHRPTVTVSLAWLEQILTWADDNGLEYVTFRDLVPAAEPRAALALAFDDNTPDEWMLARDTLAHHGARVTFFVSQWQDITPQGHEEIALLYRDGHDIEAHSVNHINAADYVKAHGIAAYMSDEVLPSMQVLVDAGFPEPVAYAYPSGIHTPAIDEAVLDSVDKVRTTPGECPWAGWGR
jgi:peptidoglycan/xylan/chitin deacetylase (PgdA/CDA1 family)